MREYLSGQIRYQTFIKFKISEKEIYPAVTRRLHNVASTSMQRHDVASTLRWRCINVMCPLGRVKKGSAELLEPYLDPAPYWEKLFQLICFIEPFRKMLFAWPFEFYILSM